MENILVKNLAKNLHLVKLLMLFQLILMLVKLTQSFKLMTHNLKKDKQDKKMLMLLNLLKYLNGDLVRHSDDVKQND